MSSKVLHRALISHFNQDTQLTQQDAKKNNTTDDKVKIPKKFKRLEKWAESTNINITAIAVVVDFMK